jgi:peptide/nickel transport system permease protein
MAYSIPRSDTPSLSRWFRSLLDSARERPMGAICAGIMAVFVFSGVFADLVAPYGSNEMMPGARLQPPSTSFPLGTDYLGRDLLSRIIYGAQLSLTIGLCTATLATLISIVIGLCSGYFGKRVDLIVQRFVDGWMSFPDLILLIAAVSVVGSGMFQVIAVLSVNWGITGSRVIRGAVMTTRQSLYIQAAQAMGASTLRIMIHHVLPNILPPVILLFTMRVGAAILAEAALSFLGLGVPPPAPSWGGMLSGSGRNFMYLAPQLAIIPGLCLLIVVFSINVLGDAIRDLVDPRLTIRRRRRLGA